MHTVDHFCHEMGSYLAYRCFHVRKVRPPDGAKKVLGVEKARRQGGTQTAPREAQVAGRTHHSIPAQGKINAKQLEEILVVRSSVTVDCMQFSISGMKFEVISRTGVFTSAKCGAQVVPKIAGRRRGPPSRRNADGAP